VPHPNQLVITDECPNRSGDLIFAAEAGKFTRKENLVLAFRDQRLDFHARRHPLGHPAHIPRIFALRSCWTVGRGFGVSPSSGAGAQGRALNIFSPMVSSPIHFSGGIRYARLHDFEKNLRILSKS